MGLGCKLQLLLLQLRRTRPQVHTVASACTYRRGLLCTGYCPLLRTCSAYYSEVDTTRVRNGTRGERAKVCARASSVLTCEERFVGTGSLLPNNAVPGNIPYLHCTRSSVANGACVIRYLPRYQVGSDRNGTGKPTRRGEGKKETPPRNPGSFP